MFGVVNGYMNLKLFYKILIFIGISIKFKEEMFEFVDVVQFKLMYALYYTMNQRHSQEFDSVGELCMSAEKCKGNQE